MEICDNNLSSLKSVTGQFDLERFLLSGWSDIESRDKLFRSDVSDEIVNILSNRIVFREYCDKLGLKQPERFFSDKFSKISDWLVKKNSFPKVVKLASNLSDCESILKLTAFREITSFQDSVRESEEPVFMVEDWIKGLARIEVTVVNKEILYISQVGLAKSLYVKHSWRIFPVAISTVLKKKITNIIAKFDELLLLKNVPVRFSIIVGKSGIVPVSVNVGLNRLEYYPDWSEKFGYRSLFDKKPMKESPNYIFRINFFHKSLNEILTEEDVNELNPESLVKFANTTDSSVVLLKAKDINTLKKDYNQIRSKLRNNFEHKDLID